MKHVKINLKNLAASLALPAFLFLFSSCSKKIYFENSSVVPAAQGYVKIKKDNNNNSNIDIKVMHLADPMRLQPSAKTYVIWMDTESNSIKNLGQLESRDHFLSKTLKGSFNAVTAFKPVKIFITAEDDAAISSPRGRPVLETKKF